MPSSKAICLLHFRDSGLSICPTLFVAETSSNRLASPRGDKETSLPEAGLEALVLPETMRSPLAAALLCVFLVACSAPACAQVENEGRTGDSQAAPPPSRPLAALPPACSGRSRALSARSSLRCQLQILDEFPRDRGWEGDASAGRTAMGGTPTTIPPPPANQGAERCLPTPPRCLCSSRLHKAQAQAKASLQPLLQARGPQHSKARAVAGACRRAGLNLLSPHAYPMLFHRHTRLVSPTCHQPSAPHPPAARPPSAAAPEGARVTTYLGTGGISAECQRWDTATQEWVPSGDEYGELRCAASRCPCPCCAVSCSCALC